MMVRKCATNQVVLRVAEFCAKGSGDARSNEKISCQLITAPRHLDTENHATFLPSKFVVYRYRSAAKSTWVSLNIKFKI